MKVVTVKAEDIQIPMDRVVKHSSCTAETIVVVDSRMRVVFGFDYVETLPPDSELEVVVVDSDKFEDLQLSMYASGRLAVFDWKKLSAMDSEKYGFGPYKWADKEMGVLLDSLQEQTVNPKVRKLF